MVVNCVNKITFPIPTKLKFSKLYHEKIPWILKKVFAFFATFLHFDSSIFAHVLPARTLH